MKTCFFFTIIVLLFLPHNPLTESRFIKKRSLVVLRQSWLQGVEKGEAYLDVLNLANEVRSMIPLSGTSNPAIDGATTMVIIHIREIFCIYVYIYYYTKFV